MQQRRASVETTIPVIGAMFVGTCNLWCVERDSIVGSG